MASILGMGNPLLDISDNVDKAMLEKYGLEPGGIILAEDKHQPLFPEMAKRPGVQYIAGGATQNSIRVAQWMLQAPGSTAYMGCVGQDEFAEKMKASCEKDGVKTAYMVDTSTPTGSCAVLIEGIERSLCTNLMAANNFKVDHVQKPENFAVLIEGIERSLCTNLMAANNFKVDHVQKPENLKLVQEAKIIYSAGFFITVSTDSMRLASSSLSPLIPSFGFFITVSTDSMRLASSSLSPLIPSFGFFITVSTDSMRLASSSLSPLIPSFGFFITVSTDSMRLAAKEAAKSGAKYCMNLSAPFLMQVPPFKAFITEIMPLVDYLFCNETEALTYAETEGWDTTDIAFIATRLSLIPSSKGAHRTVVVTQGCDPTVVAVHGHVTQYPVIVLPKEKLVDTNGAGDSYVGGFLAALSKGLPIVECCKAGGTLQVSSYSTVAAPTQLRQSTNFE
eukprot:CAMPEP_0169364802 /NCGR_PEP_ID=MMETSP1017-20121227/32204_1 /TAXON_ID=342587 /ORGANISM="Karlodinium micrum, Strain CCMP2283" /LENGTH=448 /DNA_ID=CAMNT_0009462549 /DNA_START=60 /DNA_END=1407 /DNA_ORIENTATION=+